LSVWSCLGFNFIKLTAIGKLLVPGNVEKLTFFALHLTTITLSFGRLKNTASQNGKPPEGAFGIS
jgi:hypothetical protein